MTHFTANGCVLAESKHFHELGGFSLPAWESLLECEGIMRCRCAIWGLDLMHARGSFFLCVAKHLFPIRPTKRMLIERAVLFYIVVNMLIWFSPSLLGNHMAGVVKITALLSSETAERWTDGGAEREGRKLSVVKIRVVMGRVWLSQCVMNSWACIRGSCYKLKKRVRTVTGFIHDSTLIQPMS